MRTSLLILASLMSLAFVAKSAGSCDTTSCDECYDSSILCAKCKTGYYYWGTDSSGGYCYDYCSGLDCINSTNTAYGPSGTCSPSNCDSSSSVSSSTSGLVNSASGLGKVKLIAAIVGSIFGFVTIILCVVICIINRRNKRNQNRQHLLSLQKAPTINQY